MRLPLLLLIPTSHLVDRDHVTVGHQHVHLVVKDLRIDVEVVSDAFVQDGVPRFFAFLCLRRVVADTVAPNVENLSHVEFQFRKLRRISDWIFLSLIAELQVEQVEVCLHIDALAVWHVPVVHEHEIRVDLPAAILAHHNADVKALIRGWVDSGDCAVLKQRRGAHLRLGDHDAELRQEEAPFLLNFATVVVDLQVADQSVLEIFQHDTDLR